MASAVTQSRAPRKSTTNSAGDDPPADRSQMVGEAAYYLAEQRGFAGGDPMRDWLDAEEMIDHVLMGPKGKTKAK